jgi:aspartate aminotransferase
MSTPKLSVLAESLIGSEIVKLGNQIRQRISQGETIYNFTVGDFDPQIFPIPQALENEIIHAYKNKFTSYPLADGELDLRTSVAAFLKKWHDLDYNVNEIQIASGGRPLIYTIFKTIVDAGDKVIYAIPSWNNNHYVHLTNGQHIAIDTTPENNFMPTAASLEPHIADAVLLCLCTPQNPTGTTLQKDELKKICDLIVAENQRRGDAKKIYLLYDQMYGTLTLNNLQHINPVTLVPAMKDYTIFVDGISKAFCATGVRVGWSMGPAELINKMKAILSHVGAWAPMAEQKAVAKYLQRNEDVKAFLFEYNNELDYRLQAISNGFTNLKNKGYNVDVIAPQAAIYLTVQLNLAGKTTANGTILSTQEDVTSYLLENAGLALVPFYAFGAPKTSSWYRLSIGTCKKQDIEPMLEKLEAALEKLSD